MSQETIEWLNNNILVGMTEKYGHAWHYEEGATNHYPHEIPVEDIRKRLFGWEALEADAFFEGTDGKMHGAGNHKVIYRSDNFRTLGIHSQGWECHGYQPWLIDNVANIIDDELLPTSAGLLKQGAVAFVQLETPEHFEGPQGETFRTFIAATTSMDGSLATRYKVGATRIVCDNTSEQFFGESGGEFKVKHTRYSAAKLTDIRSALGLITKVSEEYVQEMETLMGRSVTDNQWGDFIESYVPIDQNGTKNHITIREGKRMALARLYTSDDRVAPWTGTAWGVLQAVSTYQQHERGIRQRQESTNRVERNWMEFLKGKQSEDEQEAMGTLSKVLA